MLKKLKGKIMSNSKTKKILGVILNIIITLVLIFVAFITLNIIFSRDRGYTPLFGSAFVSVQSDSMEGEKPFYAEGKPDGFNTGDLIKITLLDDTAKAALEAGDVITFYQTIGGERQLNTHRIVSTYSVSGNTYFITKGDNNEVVDAAAVSGSSVIGRYDGVKIAGFGKITDFFRTSTGFFVCVVIPSFLIVVYFAFNLWSTVKKNREETAVFTSIKDKEEIKKELLKELVDSGVISAEDAEKNKTD